MIDLDRSAKIAQQYLGTDSTLHRLGWGVSGSVYLSPDGTDAVKVYHGAGFYRELEIYQRLKELRLLRVCGLRIPLFKDYRAKNQILRIEFVTPPFLPDFAGASFEPPDFSDDTMDHWRQTIEDRFGPNADICYAFHEALRSKGIYMDFRPSNLNITGLPGTEPDTPIDTD